VRQLGDYLVVLERREQPVGVALVVKRVQVLGVGEALVGRREEALGSRLDRGSSSKVHRQFSVEEGRQRSGRGQPLGRRRGSSSSSNRRLDSVGWEVEVRRQVHGVPQGV